MREPCPRRLQERAKRGAAAMAGRIGRMTVAEVRDLQRRTGDQWPTLAVGIRLSYRGGSFSSLRYTPDHAPGLEPACRVDVWDNPQEIAGDLLRAALTEHARRMLLHSHGPEPMLAASVGDLDVAMMFLGGDPGHPEVAAWRAIAEHEVALRRGESAHRRLRRHAAMRERQEGGDRGADVALPPR